MADDPKNPPRGAGLELSTAPVALHAFGNRSGPRAPRLSDFNLSSEQELVGPEKAPLPMGASTVSDPEAVDGLSGHYHVLDAGTPLPEGLGVVKDDQESVPNSTNPRTHHTIFPSRAMPFREFQRLFVSLPWRHCGKKERE